MIPLKLYPLRCQLYHGTVLKLLTPRAVTTARTQREQQCTIQLPELYTILQEWPHHVRACGHGD